MACLLQQRDTCLSGLEIAWAEMRLLLAHIFRKFELHIDEQANIGDNDILTYHDGFTDISKNWC